MRRAPIETGLSSTVRYPSALFSLERDEIYPYERFAYNVLNIGVEALHVSDLPECLVVDFTHLLPGRSPWSINASISIDRDSDGQPLSFRIATPELAPAVFYMFSNIVVSQFFDEAKFEDFKAEPSRLGEKIQFFIDSGSAGIRTYRDKGLGPAIRAAYDHLGFKIIDLENCADYFDLLTKQIAYHEVAHAYVRQFMRKPVPTQKEQQAFELIADLVATEWFYNQMVRNTPDTDEYRCFRGMNTYADTILANAIITTQSQQASLMLSAIAGAQRSGGSVSLVGGAIHPPGLQRYQLQRIHLYTLIASNFSHILSQEQLNAIDQEWEDKIDTLARSGMLPLTDLESMFDLSQCERIEVAADLIEEMQIPELLKITDWLRATRGILSEILNSENMRP
jgi:hypothetical protein